MPLARKSTWPQIAYVPKGNSTITCSIETLAERFFWRLLCGILQPGSEELLLTLAELEEKDSYIVDMEQEGYFTGKPIHRELMLKKHAIPESSLTENTDRTMLDNLVAAMDRLLRYRDGWNEMEAQETPLDKARTAIRYYKGTPLHFAVAHGDKIKVDIMLQVGVEIQDSVWRFPIEVALITPVNIPVHHALKNYRNPYRDDE